MKKTISLLIVLFTVLSISLSAQKPFAGTIKMQVRAEGTTDANILSQYQGEQEMTVFGNKSKVVQDSEGIGVIYIEDGDNQTTTTVIDLSLMGYGMYYNIDTVEKPQFTQYDYTYDKNDTKTIAGYKSYKAVCTITNLETDETRDITMYVTDDLTPNYKSIQFMGLQGYPLSFMVPVEDENGDVAYTIVQEVLSIKPDKKIKNANFLIPSQAVSVNDMPAELKQMFGME